MPEDKAPEQTSKPARRVSPPPATETPICEPIHSNETFARKVESVKHLFFEELRKRGTDTAREAVLLGKPIDEREKRDRELEPLLISWLDSSVQCLEEWFWKLHNIAATSQGGPEDSAADWAGQAAGEVVRGYFKFEKEVNAGVPNTIYWWWRFATEHADGRVSQDVPERWNTNFSSRIEHVLESLVHHAVLGIRGPSLARIMAGSNDLSGPDPIQTVITPATEEWEQITPVDLHAAVRAVHKEYSTAFEQCIRVGRELCYSNLHPGAVDVATLEPQRVFFSEYCQLISAPALERFAKALASDQPPSIFKAYLDLSREGLKIATANCFNSLLEIGNKYAQSLSGHPIDWAKQQLTSLINGEGHRVREWVILVCDHVDYCEESEVWTT